MRLRSWLLSLSLLLPAAPAIPQDLMGHGGPVRALAALGPFVVSGGFDHAVIVWNPMNGRAMRVSRWHQAAVGALATLPDGRFASGGEDGRIALWAPGRDEDPDRVLEGHGAPVVGLAADGARLASASWDGTVRLWDLAAGGVQLLRGHQGNVNGVAFGSGGALFSAGQDGTIREWAPDGTPKTIAEFGLPQNALLALPDGTLAAAGVDGALRLVARDGAVREIQAGPRPIIALAASPDGSTLAAGTVGGGVGLWDVASGRLRATLDGPGLPVWSLAFAPDGLTLWSGGQDRRVRRWEAATARALGPLAPEAADDLPAGADPEGAVVWRACQACHALRADAPQMAGPHLQNLFGRRMGSVPGYRYSARLAQGDITWTPETVADLFTRGPDTVVPGTTMPVQTVGQAEELAALIRFLEQATR
jgi:cytochrome c